MKKTIVLVSTILLFAGLTFGQTPQAQDKATSTTTTKKEATTAPSKDAKGGCDEKTKAKCASSKDAKSGCCAHDKKGEGKKECKDTKAPEKK